MGDLGQGWAWPLNSRKAHWFAAGSATSICGRWMFFGRREDTKHNSPDNCRECVRRREKHVGSAGAKARYEP